MNGIRRFVLFMLVIGLTTSVSPAGDAPDILKQVPESAHAVIVAPHINQLVAKVMATRATMGLPNPDAASPLPDILEDAGLGKGDGIDLDGGAAFVVPLLRFDIEPEMIALLKLTDAEQFKGNFEDLEAVEGEAEIYTGTSSNGETFYLGFRNDYAIIAEDINLLKNYNAPEDADALFNKAGTLGGGAMNDCDIFLYANVEQISPMYAPMIGLGLVQAENQIDQMEVMLEPFVGNPETVKALVQMLGGLANTILTETDAVVVSGQLAEIGMTVRLSAQFKDGSAMAQALGNIPSADLNLDRLPDKPFLYAGAIRGESLPIEPVLAEVNRELVPKLAAGVPLTKFVRAYVDALDVFQQTVTSFQVLYEAPSAEMTSIPATAYVMEVSDTDTYMTTMEQAVAQMVEGGNDLMQLIDQMAGGQMGPAFNLSYTGDARTIEGVSVHEFKMEMSEQIKQMQAQMQAQMQGGGGMGAMPMFWSGLMMNGYSEVFGAKDNLVLGMVNPDDEKFAALVRASDGSGRLTQQAQILAARQRLPEARFAEGYLNINPILQMMFAFQAQMAAQFGAETPPLPPLPELSPIAIAGSSSDNGIQFTAIIPADAMQSLAMLGLLSQSQVAMHEEVDMAVEIGAEEPGAPVAVPTAPDPNTLVHELTDANHDAVIEAGKPTVVVYWATWSRNGVKQVDALTSVAKQLKGRALFATVDIEAAIRTADTQEIGTVPTTIIYKAGREIDRRVGPVSRTDLMELVKTASR